MSKTKVFIGLAVTVGAVMAAATPAPAWFKDLHASPTGACESLKVGECGINLTEIVLTPVAGISIVCPSKVFHVDSWQIEKDEPQERVVEGPHESIKFSCTEGKLDIGESKGPVRFEECVIQLAQEKGQLINVVGKFSQECVIKADGALCIYKIPAGPANQGLGNITLSNGEEAKHGKYLLVKPELTGIVSKANSKTICGYTESTEGKLEGDLDLFTQDAI